MQVPSNDLEYITFEKTEKSSLLHKENGPQFSTQWPQHLAALSGSLIAFSSGCVAGWSSPAIPHLQGNLGTLNIEPLTSQEASWVGSIHTLGALFGSFPAGELAGIFGRKSFLLFLALPLVAGWSIILYGYERVNLIYLGRFVNGLSFGAMAVVVPMYNNEIAEDNVRGVMGVYFDIMWCAGILWVYVMGAYYSFFWFTLSCGLMPIIFVAIFMFMPESPVFLLMKGNLEAAEKSLRWLRRGDTSEERTYTELKKLQELLHEPNVQPTDKKMLSEFSYSKSFKEYVIHIFQSTQCIAVLIGIGLMTFQKLSGISIMVYYTVDIFRGAGVNIAPEMAAIIVGTVCLITTGVSAGFVDKLGRKALLITSGAMMAICLAVMSTYSILTVAGWTLTNLNWVPLLVLSCYVGFYGLGYGPIPWFMVDELLPKETKTWANSCIICYNWFLTFLVAKSFGPMVDNVGYGVTYAIYSLICAISVFFIEFCVPETTNKSFLEINREISGLFKVKYEKTYGTIKEQRNVER